MYASVALFDHNIDMKFDWVPVVAVWGAGLSTIHFLIEKWPKTWWPRKPEFVIDVSTGAFSPTMEAITTDPAWNFEKIRKDLGNCELVLRIIAINHSSETMILSSAQLGINGVCKYMLPWPGLGNPNFPHHLLAHDKCIVRFPLEKLAEALHNQSREEHVQLFPIFHTATGLTHHGSPFTFAISEWKSTVIMGKTGA